MSGLAQSALYQDINVDNLYQLKDCCNTLVDPTNNLARLVRSFAVLFDPDTFYHAPLFLHIDPYQNWAIVIEQIRQLVLDTVARMVNLDRFMCNDFPACCPSMAALLSHPNTSTISHLTTSVLRKYLPHSAAVISYLSIPSEIQPNLPFLTSLDIDAHFITAHPVAYAEFFQRLLASHCHRLTELVLRGFLKDAECLLETSSDFSLLGTLVVHPSVLVIKKLLLAPSVRTLHVLGNVVEYGGFVPEVSVPVNAFPQLRSLSCPSTFLPVFLRNRVDRPHVKTICLDDAFYLNKARLPRNHTWPSWHAVRTALSGLQYSFKNLVDLSFCVVHLDVYLLLTAGLEFPSLQKLIICLWTDPSNLHCLTEDQDIQQFLTGLPSLQTFQLSDGPMYEIQRAVKLFEHATDIALQKTAAKKWGMLSLTLTRIAFTTACEWHRELGEWYKEDHKRCLRRRDNGVH